MSKIFPLLLNSIFFIAGVCSIAFERPFLCAASLLAISLLYIWKPGIKKMETVDDGTKAGDGGAKAADDRDVRETDHQITELSLRVQELTESNRLLNEEIDHLKGEQETCLHPLYSCPLTSAFPINLEGFFTDYIKEHFDDSKSGVHPEFHCAVPEAETYLSAAALGIICDNVIDNMLKFSPTAPDRYGTIYIRITDLDGDVLIIFKNEGEGIPDHEAARIFDLNYQGSNRKCGNGLGLAQVNALVSDYGGRTWAKSSRNTGFALYIQLPPKPHS